MILVANTKRVVNPMRLDPSRTATLRRQFEEDIRRRFKSIQTDLIKLIMEEDAFGLKPQKRSVFNEQVTNERWKFLSKQQQLKRFQEWLKEQYDLKLLADQQAADNAYWNHYVQEGYKKGAGRAFDDTRKVGLQSKESLDFYNGTKDEFLRSSFGAPESIEKVKILASRVFTDLVGVTQGMATQMNRSLTDGLVQGQNPLTVARTLVKDLGISRNRAETIARTEIIRAHAEGQLDAFQRLGVTKLGVMVEWATAQDDRVCPRCRPLQGATFTLKEASGLIPRHPNCRCTWYPANLGESKKGQLRGKAKIDAAIKKSIAAEKKKRHKTFAQTAADSTWAGADTAIGKSRPDALVTPLAAKKLGGQVAGSLPKEILEHGTKEEQKQLMEWAHERARLNKIVKAGSATQEQIQRAKEVSFKFANLRAEIRARGGIIDKKIAPRLVQPQPAIVAKPLPIVPQPQPIPSISGAPSHIIFSGKATEFSRKVWAEVGGGIRDANHARTIGEMIRVKAETDPALSQAVVEVSRLREQVERIRVSLVGETYDAAKWQPMYQTNSKIVQLNEQIKARRLEAYREALREVRDFDHTGLTFSPYADKDINPLFTAAAKNLPDDWTKAVEAELELKTGKTKRGYFKDLSHQGRVQTSDGLARTRAEIMVSGSDPKTLEGVATHELIHAVSRTRHRMVDLERQFIDSRLSKYSVGAKKGEIKEKIKRIYPRSKNQQDEVGYKDKFKDHYCGRVYQHHAAEVMTVGAGQGMVEGYSCVIDDEDYLNFVLGVLAGL